MEPASKRARTDYGVVESSPSPAPSMRLTVEQASDVMNKLISKYHSKAQTLGANLKDSQEGDRFLERRRRKEEEKITKK